MINQEIKLPLTDETKKSFILQSLRNGGEWLGNVRNWIQRKVQNGEYVTWGSNDILGGFDTSRIDSHKPFTVKEIEDIAQLAAEGAYWQCMDDIRSLIYEEICELNIKTYGINPNKCKPDLRRIDALKEVRKVLFG
jgi:hypothetical protein